jgi:hypothetical protein
MLRLGGVSAPQYSSVREWWKVPSAPGDGRKSYLNRTITPPQP